MILCWLATVKLPLSILTVSDSWCGCCLSILLYKVCASASAGWRWRVKNSLKKVMVGASNQAIDSTPV